jgi:hypothetical protein
MVTLLTAVLLQATPAPWKELSIPDSLRRVLDSGAYGATPGGFRAITLSHLADGCAAQGQSHPDRLDEARRCVTTAFQRAAALEPEHCLTVDRTVRCDVEPLARTANPLFLSHFLLVLGAADQVEACPDPALHVALADALARQTMEDPWRVVPSYRDLPLRWPADQSALLAGLKRTDDAHGTAFHVKPTRAFFEVLESKGTHRSGLPVSELTGQGPGAKHPRGCAQSFISRYLAEVEPGRTKAWWKTYRAGFLVRLPFGIVGFREWPAGVERGSDVDSGPIVLGIGVSASALAISAAKANGDAALATQLEASADRVLSLGVGSDVVHVPFAEAIRFEARWRPVAVTPALP